MSRFTCTGGAIPEGHEPRLHNHHHLQQCAVAGAAGALAQALGHPSITGLPPGLDCTQAHVGSRAIGTSRCARSNTC
eukprot:scaffold253699_cov22-Tisochrysis_lutea.AAC.1